MHELLERRHSPYVFAAERDVSADDMRGLLEAARWTMSSYNEQPWRYVVGSRSRSPEVWQAVLEVLVPGNRGWARHAPILMLGLISTRFSQNGKPNKAAAHDLGAASACLTIEATARGLSVHQMIGIEPAEAARRFALPESVEALTGLAIGYAGNPADCDADYAARDSRPRERKALDDILWQLPDKG
ncbi:MAG: nitroreductase family protein [Gammaproteobacteria bacterium]|nr:nitroreductase family protein [Gammaproteobacteria bacterium]